jgi:signal transduction histidine kinase
MFMAAQPPSSQHQSISHFLSLVSHELRSPLNTLNGYLDLLLEGIAGELNEQQREFVQRARAGSEHLYSLLEDLLLIARADAGQLRLNRTAHSLEELVNAAREELELAIMDAGVTLEIALPANLPELFVDATRIQQVLRNLLSNALRFTPAGGRVTIDAHAVPARQEGERERVEVSVRDSGCGIAPEYLERVFERFFQAPRAEGGRGGQGLGLAVVKTIVEAHGGRVWVESTPGEGSTFLFTL